MIVSFAFLVKTVWNMKFDLSTIKHPFAATVEILIISLSFAVVVYISAFAWNLILQFLNGSKLPFNEIRSVYVKANIGKYLPGNVMHFAGRNVLGKKYGFSQWDMALSTIIEVLTLLFTACLWAIILAYGSFRHALLTLLKGSNIIIVELVIAAVVVLAAAAVFYAAKKGYLKKLRKLLSKKFLLLFIKLVLIYSVTLIVPGIFLAFIFFCVLGASLTSNAAVLIIAAYIISWALGYIVPGAPGGIGVREMALVLILGSVCTNQLTVVAIVLHRIASIFGDAIAFFAETLLTKNMMKG